MRAKMRGLGVSVVLVAVMSVAAADLVFAAEEQSCTYSLSPLSITVPGAGGSGQVSVTTIAGCAWTASTGTPWLSVRPGGGTGSGVVTWTAVANSLSTQRLGLLTIAGRDIFVVQLQPSVITAPPGAPRQLGALVSGSTVSLTWSAPDSGGTPSTYIISAGSASGWSNLASISTGSTQTTFTAPGVPNGVYFARVSAQNSLGTSPPSNEVSFSVPQPCSTLTSAPSGLQSAVSGLLVTLAWVAPPETAPSAYVIEVGSAPGLADFGAFNTGSAATTLSATAMPGTYYVRVRAVTACGLTPPSSDVGIVVR